MLAPLRVSILPVFAGMIRTEPAGRWLEPNSPRIRGDDPFNPAKPDIVVTFSPYSRG